MDRIYKAPSRNTIVQIMAIAMMFCVLTGFVFLFKESNEELLVKAAVFIFFCLPVFIVVYFLLGWINKIVLKPDNVIVFSSWISDKTVKLEELYKIEYSRDDKGGTGLAFYTDHGVFGVWYENLDALLAEISEHHKNVEFVDVPGFEVSGNIRTKELYKIRTRDIAGLALASVLASVLFIYGTYVFVRIAFIAVLAYVLGFLIVFLLLMYIRVPSWLYIRTDKTIIYGGSGWEKAIRAADIKEISKSGPFTVIKTDKKALYLYMFQGSAEDLWREINTFIK